MAEQDKTQTENTGGFNNQTTGAGTSAKTAKDNSTTGGESGSSENSGTLSNVTSKVKGLYEKAADSQVGQVAKDALGQVKENASTAIDEKKTNIAQGLSGVAETIRQVGDSVKPPEGEEPNKLAELTTQYSDTISKQVEKVSDYLESQDLRTMARDVESFARRNPAIFLGAAFALGVLAARFLKSTPTGGGSSKRALMNRSDAAGTGFGGNLSPSSTGINSGTGSTTSGNSLKSSESSTAADNVRQFNSGSTGSGANPTSQDYSFGSTSSGSSTGSVSTEDSPASSPKPSNKTSGDFGSSNS